MLIDSQTEGYNLYDGTTHTINGIDIHNNSYADTASPYLSGLYRFYQRDEVYRFGIVFKNKKGLSSYVKWIGDIRMPVRAVKGYIDNIQNAYGPNSQVGDNALDMYPIAGITSNGNNWDTYANGLYLIFHISLPQTILDTCSSFDIVRVKRTMNDRHILCQGLLEPVLKEVGYSFRGKVIVPNNDIIYHHNRYMITPEVEYNKDIFGLRGDYLQPVFFLGLPHEGWPYGHHAGGYEGLQLYEGYYYKYGYVYQEFHFSESMPPYGSSESVFYKSYDAYKIDSAMICEGNKSTDTSDTFHNCAIEWGVYDSIRKTGLGTPVLYIEGGNDYIFNFDHYYNYSDDDWQFALNGVDLLDSYYDLSSCPLGASSTPNKYFTVFDYKRPLNNYIDSNDYIGMTTQYYGADYNARSQNTYISCGVNQKINPNQSSYDIDCFGGDTFICMFENYNLVRPINTDTNWDPNVNVCLFPVETSINLPLVHGHTYKNCPMDSNKENNQIFKGIYTVDSSFWGWSTYTQEKDMFLYNSVFSKERDTELFLPKPADKLFIDEKPYTNKFSLTKIDDEMINSWTTFLVNNYNDCEGKYGEITDLVNFKDRLLNIQPSGIGIWSVLDRSLIKDKSGLELSLGTGAILSRIDYPITTKGSKHQSSILTTTNGLYFFDVFNKEWNRLNYGEGILSLTAMKKMSSYLKGNLHPKLYNEDNAINNSLRGFALGWDKEFNEIYLSCKQSGCKPPIGGIKFEDYTIVYNELLNRFTGFYDIYTCKYINTENKLLSVPGFKLVQINPVVNRNQLWLHNKGPRGRFYDKVYPSILKYITTAQGTVGTFTNLLYLSEVYDINDNDLQETYGSIHCINDHQDSGNIILNQVNSQGIGNIRRRLRHWSVDLPRDITSDHPRLRDAYLMTKLSFDNVGDKRIISHDIITSFYPSNR